jgi:class 3 adenylate cyclase
LTGVRHRVEPESVLATVLFTRIAAAKDIAARLGETRWEELILRLRAHIRKEIEWYRGREVEMVDDRPLAIFDGPARAIRCAHAYRVRFPSGN